jgi:thymidylate kinase
MPATSPPFCVLVGPDYAGKSSALSRLRRSGPPWRLLSVDDDHLAPEHALLGRIRRDVVREVAGRAGTWSPDFLTTMLQTAAVHLRDRLAEDPTTPTVVDSYYYKLLAKARLAGADNGALLDWWRSFPQPRRVLYLEVRPEVAWQRSSAGAALNCLEYYGDRPSWDGFRRYQGDLAKTMHDEISHLPVTVIEQQDDPDRTAESIRKVLADELG